VLSEINKLTSIEKRSAAGAAFLVPDMRLMPIDPWQSTVRPLAKAKLFADYVN